MIRQRILTAAGIAALAATALAVPAQAADPGGTQGPDVASNCALSGTATVSPALPVSNVVEADGKYTFTQFTAFCLSLNDALDANESGGPVLLNITNATGEYDQPGTIAKPGQCGTGTADSENQSVVTPLLDPAPTDERSTPATVSEARPTGNAELDAEFPAFLNYHISFMNGNGSITFRNWAVDDQAPPAVAPPAIQTAASESRHGDGTGVNPGSGTILIAPTPTSANPVGACTDAFAVGGLVNLSLPDSP
jgi:hypothetical protein